MSPRGIRNWMIVAIAALTVCVIAVYGFALPSFGESMVQLAPEFQHWYLPWLIFLLITALPCLVIFWYALRVALQIGRDDAFSPKTAKYIRRIAIWVLADIMYFFGGNVVMLLVNMNHPGVFLGAMLLVVIGLVIASAAEILSRYIQRAYELQEQADSTV